MSNQTATNSMRSLISNKLYDKLKFVSLILLPAAGACYFGLASIWGFPNAEQVVGTITVVDTFLGVLLGISTSSYNKSDARFDGSFSVEEKDDTSYLKLKSVDYDSLVTKDELTFKIDR